MSVREALQGRLRLALSRGALRQDDLYLEDSTLFPVVGSPGSMMLLSFPVESFFARNIPLGADFYSDADQSEWIPQKWILRLQVHKVSLGAGSVAGMLFTYRRSTS